MFMDRKPQYCQDAVLPNVIYRFNAISVETLACYFVDIDKLILKFICVSEALLLLLSRFNPVRLGATT